MYVVKQGTLLHVACQHRSFQITKLLATKYQQYFDINQKNPQVFFLLIISFFLISLLIINYYIYIGW